MIQDDIINELQYIPEAKLIEVYEMIHSFRIKFGTKPKTDETDYILQNKDLMQQIALSTQTHQKTKRLQVLIAQGDADIKAGRVTEYASANALANRITGE